MMKTTTPPILRLVLFVLTVLVAACGDASLAVIDVGHIDDLTPGLSAALGVADLIALPTDTDQGLLIRLQRGPYVGWLESRQMPSSCLRRRPFECLPGGLDEAQDQALRATKPACGGELAVRLASDRGDTVISHIEGEVPADWHEGEGYLPGKDTLESIAQALANFDWPPLRRTEGQHLIDLIEAGLDAHAEARARNGGMERDEPATLFGRQALQRSAADDEFQQVIWLYGVRLWPTDYDHTATRAIVFSRPAGSTQPWYPKAQTISCNHGVCPMHRFMQQYDACLDTPVTRGWYGLGQHCAGDYLLSHLCNDDTALQINQAYGVRGTGHCTGSRRLHRPTCGVQWGVP